MEETKLAWLAGLVDGEGCLHARHVQSNSGKTKNSIFVKLEIHSVSKNMIDAVCSILDDLGITYYRAQPKFQPMSKRPAIRVAVHHRGHLRTLLTALVPYLIVKKAEAELTLTFINRVSAERRHRLVDDDLVFVQELKALKHVA